MEAKTKAEKPSIARGAELTAETWADFVERLRHDCVGKGVEDHYTADAIFIVQAKRRIAGIDRDYTDKWLVFCDESEWLSPLEYWNDLDEEGQEALDAKVREDSDCGFLELDESEQWDVLGNLDDHTVTGWDDQWEYVSSHFTKDAAEAFIRRKKHDYRLGLRVYVEAQVYCWEYNAIKEAILSGRVEFVGKQIGGAAYPFVHYRVDASTAEIETAIREKLIELGWTPPTKAACGDLTDCTPAPAIEPEKPFPAHLAVSVVTSPYD